MTSSFSFHPIGVFSCQQEYPQLAPRQGSLKSSGEGGSIELFPGHNYEQALEDLQRFDKIWLVYVFDRNSHWKPKVNTPRGSVKRGTFATRAPYRPNPIGLSCVTLLSVKGRQIKVKDFDLLNGTPILDIKPYLAYADSFPQASVGWLNDDVHEVFKITFSSQAKKQVQWIQQYTFDIESFITSQLVEYPTDKSRKRVTLVEDSCDQYCISARTWRIFFKLNLKDVLVEVHAIQSGYSERELNEPMDPYGDKEAHRAFVNL